MTKWQPTDRVVCSNQIPDRITEDEVTNCAQCGNEGFAYVMEHDDRDGTDRFIHSECIEAWVLAHPDEEYDDEGPTCSICDGLGHGYPGGPLCPLEVRDYSDEPWWAR